MNREETVNAKIDKIHRHQSKIKELEKGILDCFKFNGFDEFDMEKPFVQEHEDGEVILVYNAFELELDMACLIMDEKGFISPDDF